MKRILLSTAALAALALAWWIARDGGSGAGASLAPTAEEAAREAPRPAEEPALIGETVPRTSARTAEERLSDVEPEPPAAPAAAGKLALEGTVVVVDELDVEHAREDGALSLIRWKGSGGAGDSLEVTGGRFRAEVEPGAQLSVTELQLGGRPAAVLEPEGRFEVPADGRIALRARWLRGGTLEVIDADTRRPLPDVTLVRAEDWPRGDLRHPGEPGEQRVLLAHVPSPIALQPPDEREAKLHVGAPDHAWTLVTLDAVEGGERVVALPAGGALAVELVLGLVDPGAVLRVRGPDGLVAAELDVAGRSELLLDGLVVGASRVSVEIGDWWSEPRMLAQGAAEIRPGATARLRLEVADAPVSPAVPFGGVVVLPREWELERFMLVVELLDPPLGGRERVVRVSSRELTALPGHADTWRWSLPDAQAGRYELELFPLHHAISLELGPAGRDDVRLEVPPPGVLDVRVVDAATGAEAAVEHVFWNCERPEWVRGGGMARAERDDATGLWRLRAPQGRVEVHTSGGGYAGIERTVELGPEPRELELRVEREHLVRLFLREGSNAVPWERGLMVHWRPAGSDEPQLAWSAGGPELLFRVPAPGVYLVTLPELAAYEPVPEQQVTVGADATTEHAIELVRRR